MREMKDSGVEWVGEIPNNWHTAKIDSLYSLRNTKVSDYDYPPLSVTMNGIVPQLENAAKTNAHDDRKLVKAGDFAINSRSDRRGSCGISELEGSVSLINTVLKPLSNMCPRYYNWLFHTSNFSDEFYKWGHGIVDDLWTTNWQDMRKISVPVPSVIEQNRIASYLDNKCTELDALTADIQKEIEKLQEYRKSVITEAVTKGLDPDVEMKDSGVQWIGEIPKHWSLMKMKYLVGFVQDKAQEQDSSKQYIALENIESWTGKYIETDNTYGTEGALLCNKNDVIFGKLRPYLAKTMLINENSVCSSEFAVMKGNGLIPRFLNYLARSDHFISVVNAGAYGTKMPRANIDQIGNLYFPVPPSSEQERLSSFLDSKCAEIDSIIADKQKQLETLAEYRKSLIYEYVTGKKEVPTT